MHKIPKRQKYKNVKRQNDKMTKIQNDNDNKAYNYAFQKLPEQTTFHWNLKCKKQDL